MARWRVCLFLLFPLTNAQSGRRSRSSRVHVMDGRDEGSGNLFALANHLSGSDVKSNPLHGSGANNAQESSNMGGEQTSTQWSSSTTTTSAGTTFVSVALPKVVSTELVVSTTQPTITWTAPVPAQPSTSVPSSTVSTPSFSSPIISFTASPNPSPPSGSNNNNDPPNPNPAPFPDSPTAPSSKSTTTTSLTVIVTSSASPTSNPTSSSSPSTPLDLSLPASPSPSAPSSRLSASKKASIGIGITLAILTLCGLLVLLSFLSHRRRHRHLQQKHHQHDAKTETFTTTTTDDDDDTLPPRSPNSLTPPHRTVSTFSPFLQSHFTSLIAKISPARPSLLPLTPNNSNPESNSNDEEPHFSIHSASHIHIRVAHKGHGSIRSIRTRGSSSSLLSTTQKRTSTSSMVGEDGLLHPGSATSVGKAKGKGKSVVVEEVRRRLDVALTGNPVSPPPALEGEGGRWPLVE